MTDKELDQIELWLAGQKQYKLLDCSRRAFLKLKGARLQVWLAHYTSERESQQSWLSLEWLMADTGCSKPTVIAARRWLVKHGWIRVLEGSAADMYENPTQGAHKVRIVCVDDPTKGVGGKESLPDEGVKELGKEILPNVSAVAFASALAVGVASGIEATPTHATATTCMSSSPSEEPSLRETEEQQQKQNQEQKQRQQPVRVSSADKWLAKYDAPKPDWFDEAAHTAEGQLKRSAWISEHVRVSPVNLTTRVPPVPEQEVPASASAVELAPPTAPGPVEVMESAPVLSATPTPPDSAPPPIQGPMKEEEDWRKLAIERLVKDFYTLQLHFNAKQSPPIDWQSVWFAECERLYAMTEERKATMRHWMLIDLMAASQVNHANVYTSPSMILDTKLADEIIRLRTEDKFSRVWDAHWEVVCPVKHEDDEELSDDLDPVDADRKERERLRENAIGLNRWKKWREENIASSESLAAA